jgi:hypothetical protein
MTENNEMMVESMKLAFAYTMRKNTDIGNAVRHDDDSFIFMPADLLKKFNTIVAVSEKIADTDSDEYVTYLSWAGAIGKKIAESILSDEVTTARWLAKTKLAAENAYHEMYAGW